MAQAAERFFEDHLLMDLMAFAGNIDRANAELGLAALFIKVSKDLERAGDDRAHPEIADRQSRIAEHLCADCRPTAGASKPLALKFVGLVKQSGVLAAARDPLRGGNSIGGNRPIVQCGMGARPRVSHCLLQARGVSAPAWPVD